MYQCFSMVQGYNQTVTGKNSIRASSGNCYHNDNSSAEDLLGHSEQLEETLLRVPVGSGQNHQPCQLASK
jgi:hypothetical protein